MVTPIEITRDMAEVWSYHDDEISPIEPAPAAVGSTPPRGSPMHAQSIGRSQVIEKSASIGASAIFSLFGFFARFDVGAVLAAVTAIAGTGFFIADRWHKDRMRRLDEESTWRRKQREDDNETDLKIRRQQEEFNRSSLMEAMEKLTRDYKALSERYEVTVKSNETRITKLEEVAERRQEMLLEVERQRDRFVLENGELSEKVVTLSMAALQGKDYVIKATTETKRVAVVVQDPAQLPPPAQAGIEGPKDHEQP